MRIPADSVQQQQRILLGFLLWAGFSSVLLYTCIYAAFGLTGPLVAEGTYLVFTVLTLVAFYRRPGWHIWITHAQILTILAVTFLNTILLGGFRESGAWILYGVVAPVGALVFLKAPFTWLYTLGFVGDVVLCASGVVTLERTWPFPEPWQDWLMALNVVGSFALIDLTLGFFFRRFQEERRRREASMDLAVRGQKLESLGTLAAGIAHDFNNILMAFLGHVSLARRGMPQDSPEARHLQQAENAVQQATALTSQLLTFSRGGAPVRKAASILDVIRDSSTFVLHGTTSRCNFHLPTDLWPVEADRSQISQLIQNLVLNAHQAMPNGGTVQVRAANVPAGFDSPGVDRRRRYVHIEIADAGIGIPAEFLERIFEPFFTTRPEGTGLGLTSAHSIVRNHEGLVTVDSEPGKGTTIHVWLPAADAAVQPAAPPSVVGTRLSGPVLVMDDEEGVLEVLLEMIERLGVLAVGATTADEAIRQYSEALARGARFHSVILDLTLPGGRGGVEVAREILELDPQARIIASSGYADNPVFSNPARFGFVDVLRKPYSPEELERIVAEAPVTGPHLS